MTTYDKAIWIIAAIVLIYLAIIAYVSIDGGSDE